MKRINKKDYFPMSIFVLEKGFDFEDDKKNLNEKGIKWFVERKKKMANYAKCKKMYCRLWRQIREHDKMLPLTSDGELCRGKEGSYDNLQQEMYLSMILDWQQKGLENFGRIVEASK